MKNKNMTIDDLAVMVQKGFADAKDQMDERFDHVDERFGRIDADLKAIRKQLTGVVYRHEFEDLQERVKDLENMLAMPNKKAA
jgi:archaellum component FlaC